jgi:predicted ATPase
MLTRLKVSGFKNLYNVDVRFSPFTCIAGTNGVGKSNLFDAIGFLSKLANCSLVEAASSVRDEGGKTGDIRSLFLRIGDKYETEMSFEAEMIVPGEGIDELGQVAQASITFLRYKIKIGYRNDNGIHGLGSLEVLEEELKHITLGDASKNLLFPRNATWQKSAIHGKRRVPYFISTEGEGSDKFIRIHQDGKSGRALSRSAIRLPRTVLSVANAAESPTVLLAKIEMQSWRLLQLEPSALRQPDNFTSPVKLQTNGSHLAANLYHLNNAYKHYNTGIENIDELGCSDPYIKIANSLSKLINDIDSVWIDRDERRELLTLMVKAKDGTSHPARALSDGTMRFLALAVLELDPESQGLLCLEEPENGIHPERIEKILELLQNIATDPNEPIGTDNPLRQVIINTHSPAVVQLVPDDSLLVAELKETRIDERRFKRVCFSCLPDTWRVEKNIAEPSEISIISKGKLLSYLNPVIISEQDTIESIDISETKYIKNSPSRRVIDRSDIIQLLIPFQPSICNNK